MLTSSLSGEAVVVEDAEEAKGVEIALRKNWRLTRVKWLGSSRVEALSQLAIERLHLERKLQENRLFVDCK